MWDKSSLASDHVKPSTLLLTSLVGRTGSGVAATVSALYVTQEVGLGIGSVGLTLTAATAIAVAASTWLGHLADRLGAREMYAAMYVLQAIATAGLVPVRSVAAYAAVALTLAIADLGYRSAQGAVIHSVVSPESRLRVRAQVRVAANIGFAAGAGIGGIVLALDSATAYQAGLLSTAALMALTGLLVFRLPRVPRVRPGARSWEVLRDRPFVQFMTLNGVLNIHNSMLNVAVPLWIATRTDAPHWVVSVLLIVNAAAVILFQIRLTRGTDTLTGAGRAGRRAGVLLCLACVALSVTAATPVGLTVALLLLAALLHVGGEILESASGWGASYALAPPGLVGQYQGGHAMGRGLGDLIGPALLTTVAIPLGTAGWLLVAVLFAGAGLLVPVVLRRAAQGSLHGDQTADRLAPRLRPGAALAGRARSRSANRPRCGRRPGRGSRPRASARACSRSRTRTASGRAARSSRPTSASTAPRRPTTRASRGRRPRGRSTRCGSGGSTPRSCASGTAELLAENSRWEYDDLPYWGGEVDCCINAWTVANGRLARRRRHRHRRLVPRAPAARRRLELRVGRGLDPVVVPLDAQLAEGPARLRRRDRRHGCDACRPAAGEEYLLERGSSAGCRRASRWRRGWTASPIRSAGTTACSTRPTTSAGRRCSTAPRRTHGWPTRSS